MEAVHLSSSSNREWGLRENDIGIAPDEAFTGAVPPGMLEDIRKFRHLRPSGEEIRFQAECLDALEQFLLSNTEPFIWAGLDPLEGDAKFHAGLVEGEERSRPYHCASAARFFVHRLKAASDSCRRIEESDIGNTPVRGGKRAVETLISLAGLIVA